MKNTLIELIDDELNSCKWLLNAVEGDLGRLPDGSLVVNMKRNKPFFCQYSNEEGIKYIPKSNERLVSELADRESCEIIRSCLIKEIKALEKAKTALADNYWQDKLKKMHPEKRKLVTNSYYTDEEYAKLWSAQDKTDFNTLGIAMQKTHRGDLVRSKAEKIIADLLFSCGVYYRYEDPVYLKNGNKFYPDFTLLDVKNRREIYWEHFGMIDDEKYAHDAMRRIIAYYESDIIIGDNLICTFETRNFQFPFELLTPMLVKLT